MGGAEFAVIVLAPIFKTYGLSTISSASILIENMNFPQAVISP
jgi:hypothetical protein